MPIDESIFKIGGDDNKIQEGTFTDDELLSLFGAKKKDSTTSSKDSLAGDIGSENESLLDSDLSGYIPDTYPEAPPNPPSSAEQSAEALGIKPKPKTRFTAGLEAFQKDFNERQQEQAQGDFTKQIEKINKEYEEKLRVNPEGKDKIMQMWEQDVAKISDQVDKSFSEKFDKDYESSFNQYVQAYTNKVGKEEESRIAQEKAAGKAARESIPSNLRPRAMAMLEAKKMWYQIPGSQAIGMAAWTDEEPMTHTPYGSSPLFREDDPRRAEGIKRLREKKQALVEWGTEWQKKGANPMALDGWKDVDLEDPMSVLEYGISAIVETGAQLPLAAIPGIGMLSMTLQETGGSYEQQLMKIAEEKGLSVDEVIDQGLDEPIYAQTAGAIAGALENIGAISVLKAFGGLKGIKKAITSRVGTLLRTGGTEAVTEFFQEYVTSIGAEMGVDPNFRTAAKTAWKESEEQRWESARRGAIGGIFLGGLGASSRPSAIDPTAKAKNEIPKTIEKLESTKAEIDEKATKPTTTMTTTEAMESLGISPKPKPKDPASGATGVSAKDTEKADVGTELGEKGEKTKVARKGKAKTRIRREPIEVERIEDAIAEDLYQEPFASKGNLRINTDSFKQWGDPNLIKAHPTIATNYLTSKEGGISLDNLANEFQERYTQFQNMDEKEVIQAIVDFIADNPKGTYGYLKGRQGEQKAIMSDPDLEVLKDEEFDELKNWKFEDVEDFYKRIEPKHEALLNALKIDKFEEKYKDTLISGILEEIKTYERDPDGYFGPLMDLMKENDDQYIKDLHDAIREEYGSSNIKDIQESPDQSGVQEAAERDQREEKDKAPKAREEIEEPPAPKLKPKEQIDAFTKEETEGKTVEQTNLEKAAKERAKEGGDLGVEKKGDEIVSKKKSKSKKKSNLDTPVFEGLKPKQENIFEPTSSNIIKEEMVNEGIEEAPDETVADLKKKLDPIDQQIVDKVVEGEFSSENIMISGLKDEITDYQNDPIDYDGLLKNLSKEEIITLNKILNESPEQRTAERDRQSQEADRESNTENTEGAKPEQSKQALKEKLDADIAAVKAKPALQNYDYILPKNKQSKTVVMPAYDPQTGKKGSVEISALEAHKDIKGRMNVLRKLIDCLS